MRAKLTKATIASIEPRATAYDILDTETDGLLIRVQPSGKLTWYFQYKVGARKTRYKIGPVNTISPVVARDTVTKILQPKVAQGVDLNAQKVEQKAAGAREKIEAERARQGTLRVFLSERYEPWAKVERKSGQGNVDRIRTVFADLLDKPMPEITAWTIDKWRKSRREAGRRPGTLNRDFATLKACLSKAVEWNVLDLNPLAKVKPVKQDRRGKVRFLSDDEDQRLRAALRARDHKLKTERTSANAWRAERHVPVLPDLASMTYADHLEPLVLLLLNTGLRRGEAFNLTWGDVDLDRRVLTVQGEAGEDDEGEGSKSGQTRHVPLNDEALSVLRGWKAQRPSTEETDGGERVDEDKLLVFPGRDGARMSDVKTAWRRLLTAAKITGFRLHDARHDFASKLVMAGADLNTVRELLGHASLAMTLRYAHLAPEHKASAVQLLMKKQTPVLTLVEGNGTA